MGIFKILAETAGEKLAKDKEQRAREEAYVRNNPGSKAFCAFFVDLFQKGNAGYNWVKENRTGLYPVINNTSVSLCYTQYGDGKSLSGVAPKDKEVACYSFEEMYRWYGLSAGVGFSALNTRTEKNALESMISGQVQQLPHIRFNNGFMVKMFQ